MKKYKYIGISIFNRTLFTVGLSVAINYAILKNLKINY